MASELSAITNIDTALLTGDRSLATYCVAQKMSWAANRTTSRIEDRAYHLLGLFDINMPLLYGEEEKAFQRLQEGIIGSTADLSILAWKLAPSQNGWQTQDEPSHPGKEAVINRQEPYLCGLFAKSPADFQACGQYETSYEGGLREFSTSNTSIRTRIRLQEIRWTENSYSLSLFLHCTLHGVRLGILLKQVSRLDYLRQDPWELHAYGKEECVAHPPSEKNLLPRLATNYSWSTMGLVSTRETMKNLRKYVLRFKPSLPVPQETNPPSLAIHSPWPADRYDTEDALFFVSRSPQHDYGIVDATFKFHPRTTNTHYNAQSSRLDGLSCTTPARSSASSEIQTALRSSGH